MSEKTFPIVMITIAGLCLSLSLGFLTVATQAYSNQNDVAIFKTELELVHNITLENTELNQLIIINNLITKRYGWLSVMFAFLGWTFVGIALGVMIKRKKKIA